MPIEQITCPECAHEFDVFKAGGGYFLKACPECEVMIDLNTGEKVKQDKPEPRGLEAVPEKKMPPKAMMSIGIGMTVLGITFYFGRAMLAQMILGAEIESGAGVWEVDVMKVNAMILYAGILLFIGMVSLIFGIIQLKKFEREQEQNQAANTDSAAIVG